MMVPCPDTSCRAENDARNERCARCNAPISGYMKLLNHSNRLFNRGLGHAHKMEYALAREAFAAIVEWYPKDTEARNALAMACFAMNDRESKEHARFHWNKVIAQLPHDRVARQGLDALQHREKAASHLASKLSNNQKSHLKKLTLIGH